MWSALSKEKRPRNPIHRLKIPNTAPQQYEHHSKRMAELAHNHHDTLQDEDIDLSMSNEEYNRILDDILGDVLANQCLEVPERTSMSWKAVKVQYLKVRLALKV